MDHPIEIANSQPEAPLEQKDLPETTSVHDKLLVVSDEESINSGNDLDWMDQEDFESVETKFRECLSAQIMEALDYHHPKHCTYIADME